MMMYTNKGEFIEELKKDYRFWETVAQKKRQEESDEHSKLLENTEHSENSSEELENMPKEKLIQKILSQQREIAEQKEEINKLKNQKEEGRKELSETVEYR